MSNHLPVPPSRLGDHLTLKQLAFIHAYTSRDSPTYGNASASYADAYNAHHWTPNSLGSESSHLLDHPKVAPRIQAIQDDADRAAALSHEWILRRLMDNADRAMQAEPVTDDKGTPTGVYVYQGAVANRSLELLAKTRGMLIDRTEHIVAGEIVIVPRGFAVQALPALEAKAELESDSEPEAESDSTS